MRQKCGFVTSIVTIPSAAVNRRAIRGTHSPPRSDYADAIPPLLYIVSTGIDIPDPGNRIVKDVPTPSSLFTDNSA
jgi:hypothetical protein